MRVPKALQSIASPMLSSVKWVYDTVTGQMRKSRADENVDQGREAEYQQRMAALGMNELGQYQSIASGKESGIAPEQQTAIDKKVAAEQAQMRQGLASSGLSESTARLSGESATEQDRIAMQEQTREATMKQHWDAFVKATGISEGSSAVLSQMHETDRRQAMEIYAATMGAMGNVAGRASGYKSAVDEYSGAASSSDWSGSVDYSNMYGDQYQIT